LLGGPGVMSWTQFVELALMTGALIVLLVVLAVNVGRKD
jgi:Na+/proline symporter